MEVGGTLDKPQLRKRMLYARQNEPERALQAKSQQTGAHVLRFCADVAAAIAPMRRTIGIYRAVRGEVEIPYRRLLAAGWSVACPVTNGPTEPLQFVAVTEDTAWHTGDYGIPVPLFGAMVPVAELSVILVPGLAFDLRGYRVGYGGGYYDRLFADAPVSLCRVGVAYQFQVMPEVPAETHDVRVHLLVTEQGLTRCTDGPIPVGRWP